MLNQYDIKLVNEIIHEAIDHGGDSGGPYFCNLEGLCRAMQTLIDTVLGKDEYNIVFDGDDYPLIVSKKSWWDRVKEENDKLNKPLNENIIDTNKEHDTTVLVASKVDSMIDYELNNKNEKE